ncbi:MAG: DUF3098 domain-containing protein [Marinifilaceae bacterium]
MLKGFKTPEGDKSANFPLPFGSYKWIMVGFAIVVIGFFLMMGGGSEDPNVFNPDVFSFRRITLAPIVITAGFVFIFWAIMRTGKKK